MKSIYIILTALIVNSSAKAADHVIGFGIATERSKYNEPCSTTLQGSVISSAMQQAEQDARQQCTTGGGFGVIHPSDWNTKVECVEYSGNYNSKKYNVVARAFAEFECFGY